MARHTFGSYSSRPGHTGYLAPYGALMRLCNGAVCILCAIFFASATFADDEAVIVAFGDSLTQGFGLAEQDGFVPQLEAWLRANDDAGQVRVINAGVSGDTTAGGKARIGWTLSGEGDAVLLNLGANDMLRGVDPASSRANLKTILEQIAARDLPVLLTHVPAPSNFGPEYKAEFDALYEDLATEFSAIYVPNFFAGLGADSLRDAQAYMQPDGVHPNADGVRRIVEALGPSVLDLLERLP